MWVLSVDEAQAGGSGAALSRLLCKKLKPLRTVRWQSVALVC